MKNYENYALGNWIKGDGDGTMTYKDGSKYVGEWEGAHRHGQGTHTWADGTVYKGQWEFGRFRGIKQ